MSSENKVDPNTDDLEAFDLLMQGRAEVKTETDDETPEDDTLETEHEEVEDLEEEIEEEVEEEEEAPEPEPKPKAKSGVQKRIDELVAARVAAEQARQADRLEFERKLAELSAKVEAPKAEAPTPDEAPKPDAVNAQGEAVYPLGEFDPNFIRDITRFTIRQETEAAKIEAKNEAQRTEQEAAKTALASAWSEKLAKAPEKYPDIAESNLALQSTFTNLEPQYGEYLAATIMSMEKGVDVLAYLGKNLEEAKRIAASGPVQATIALGRLEARFIEGDKPRASTKVSTAPKPVPTSTRARGTGGAGNRTAADTDDLDAFEKMYFAKR